jgi:hypothetical protein
MSEHDSQRDQEEIGASTDNDRLEDDDQDYGDDDMEDEVYLNNHDLIGVEGIIRAQKNEIEKKKVKLPPDFLKLILA